LLDSSVFTRLAHLLPHAGFHRRLPVRTVVAVGCNALLGSRKLN
jgi:hypothetical protein